MAGKKKIVESVQPTLWEEVEKIEETKPKKKRSGAYSKTKGSAYERQIVNELKILTGNENLCTARSESKKLDDMKIDVADPDNILPCYIQTKKTQTIPAIKKINLEVGKKDKSLCIIWNAQEKKVGNINITSCGEYAIITKSFFYTLLESYLNESKENK